MPLPPIDADALLFSVRLPDRSPVTVKLPLLFTSVLPDTLPLDWMFAVAALFTVNVLANVPLTVRLPPSTVVAHDTRPPAYTVVSPLLTVSVSRRLPDTSSVPLVITAPVALPYTPIVAQPVVALIVKFWIWARFALSDAVPLTVRFP